MKPLKLLGCRSSEFSSTMLRDFDGKTATNQQGTPITRLLYLIQVYTVLYSLCLRQLLPCFKQKEHLNEEKGEEFIMANDEMEDHLWGVCVCLSLC